MTYRLSEIDLTDLDLFTNGFPHDLFAYLREQVPVWWHPATAHAPNGEGFWSVHTHAECLEVIHDVETYSSETGGDRPYGGTILPDLPTAGKLLNMMDDPRHKRVRLLVSKGLTPRTIGRVEQDLRRRAIFLLDRGLDKGEVDFQSEVAAELPTQAICVLLGVPEGDRHQLVEWMEPIFDFRDGREAFETTEATAAAQLAMFEYGAELIAEKRSHRTDDMLSVVVHAQLPGLEPPRLSDEELHLFFSLLFAAGSDTTRNAISGGLLALAEFPGQMALLRDDRSLMPLAVEEIVRWTHPATYNRRTATRDAHLGGHSIRAGEKVVFWEASANRDRAVFAEPMTFLLTRDPNPHVGFGHGIHHCLEASLARLEIRIVLEELLDRVKSVELAGPVEWARSNKHTGLRNLPLRLVAA